MRLAQYLARAGVSSRRAAGDLIAAGRVTVNAEITKDMSTRVRVGVDRVAVDGASVEPEAEAITLAMFKPEGFLVERGEARGRHTVFDLLREEWSPILPKLVYIGRLDMDSEGLLLLTTDGALANRAAHPRFHVEKEYLVQTNRRVPEEALRGLREGIELEDGTTQPCAVERIELSGVPHALRIVLREGRKRQIRRMIDAVGARVQWLRRVRFGPITLEGMEPGDVRRLSAKEVASLIAAGG